MCNREIINALGFLPKENAQGIFFKKYPLCSDYCVEVDFEKQSILYGDKITCDSKTTQNFSQPENFVVLECVNRLLEKGYQPQNIILEKSWSAGHGSSKYLDICVTRDDGSEYMLIECKTHGKEFTKALNRLYKDGGQLFTYFKFSNKPDLLVLYASHLKGSAMECKYEVVKIEDEYRTGDVKDFYEKWNKLTKDNGVFDSWVQPYNFKSKTLTKGQLKTITQADSSFIFNRFLEILRHNVVSDKGNAFNKIFTLFLCKVYDETTAKDGEELKFQWREGIDNDIDFQIRLTELYKNGMLKFLDRTVSDFDEEDFKRRSANVPEAVQKYLLDEVQKLRLEKNNEFAIKEVYDKDSFDENAKVVREVVELLQKYRIRYNKRQQYLSDFFELLLTTGLKQEAGQFFTPVPLAQFLIKSLPLDDIVDEKLARKDGEILPYMIDYAAGSGHFLTEYMHEVQSIINKKKPSEYIDTTKKKIKNWHEDHFDWATQYVYGIEKDYRLVKVGKVGCYLHGDGLANVILSDGLGNFEDTKDYKGKLRKRVGDGSKDNQQFDVLLSNPPYSVSSFKQTTRNYYTEKDFDLYDDLTDNSSEIEVLFVERTKQLLKDGGVSGIILPSSIMSSGGIYAKAREMILKHFEIVSLAEFGSNTFMATGTNTVVMFLRKRNNYEHMNIYKSVENFFTAQNDVALNGIEKPFSKYVTHVWENLSLTDYLTLLNKQPNEKVQANELYKEYCSKVKAKNDKGFWDAILKLELEKIFYFILAYPQQVVLVKSGEKQAEKNFLGYEFSNRRGNEGIHPIQRGKPIDECTKMFDAEEYNNPLKASTYVYRAFKGDYKSPIAEEMKEHVSRANLVDLFTFDRVDFEKSINLNAKKKVKIESKWELVKVGDIVSNMDSQRIPLSKRERVSGSYPYYGATGIIDYIDKYIFNERLVLIGEDGAKWGANEQSAFIAEGKYWVNNHAHVLKTKDNINDIYLVHVLNMLDLSEYITGMNVPKLNQTNLNEIRIPLPPQNIQHEIVAEIKAIESNEKNAEEEIDKCKETILNLLNQADSNANKTFRLSDNNIFDVSIGKRVLKNEFVENGKIPVYSANVIEPFGNIDKLLIEDFSKPSVLWGIDGDWMVNYMPEDISFYPTDHCGVLRVKDDSVNEKYLAFILEKEGKAFGFSRTNRASIDRIQGIKITVPTPTEQKKVIDQIIKLEQRIDKLRLEVSEMSRQKETILKKYL